MSGVKKAAGGTKNSWGGMEDDYGGTGLQLLLMIGYSFASMFIPYSCDAHDCSIVSAAFDLPGMVRAAQPSFWALKVWAAWVLLMLILWYVVPGTHVRGDPTPSGHQTLFKCGALNAWFVTMALCAVANHFDLVNFSEIVERYMELAVTGTFACFPLSAVWIAKAYLFPTVPADATSHKDPIQDYFLGLEIQPKAFGVNIKLFWIGRVGMILWSVLGLCHARYQYDKIGQVNYNMMVTWLLAAIYTVDWAWKEEWYLRTIDMHHDRFGFMLCGGIVIAFPCIYCAPTYFLAHYGTPENDSSLLWSLFVVVFYCGAYAFFRLCNDEKDYVRDQWKSGKKPLKGIFGNPVEVIPVKYSTLDGKERKSILLAGSLWGITRHLNYTIDLVMTSCYSFVLPWTFIFPHFYFFHMCHLLITRAERDNRKCQLKYGKYWDEYKRKVPFAIVPGFI